LYLLLLFEFYATIYSIVHLKNQTEVSRLGTGRSSMEQLFLTCLQAQLMISKINVNQKINAQQKNDLVYEVKQVTKKSCFIDAKAD
jgi:hypothetical protein